MMSRLLLVKCVCYVCCCCPGSLERVPLFTIAAVCFSSTIFIYNMRRCCVFFCCSVFFTGTRICMWFCSTINMEYRSNNITFFVVVFFLLLYSCLFARTRICMVGDRLDTDVLFGSNNGLMSILTLRCVTRSHRKVSALVGTGGGSGVRHCC